MENNNRINELYNMIYDGRACVLLDEGTAPNTFEEDMAVLFKVDVMNDVLRNLLVFNDTSVEMGVADCVLVVLPDIVGREEMFVKLADYVKGSGLDYVLCCCANEEGEIRMYSLVQETDYVEGDCEIVIETEEVPTIGAYTMCFLEDSLELGISKKAEPSLVTQAIVQGEHFAKRLIGLNNEELI